MVDQSEWVRTKWPSMPIQEPWISVRSLAEICLACTSVSSATTTELQWRLTCRLYELVRTSFVGLQSSTHSFLLWKYILVCMCVCVCVCVLSALENNILYTHELYAVFRIRKCTHLKCKNILGIKACEFMYLNTF